MNIQGISSYSATASVSVTSTNSQPISHSNEAGANSAAASSHISGPGKLFSRLQQLANTDPAKFKEVAKDISDQLHQAAQQSSGKEAEFENNLADKFAQAAQSGDMSAFRPPQGGPEQAQHHHHHHHHGGGGAGAIGQIMSQALDEVNQALGTSTASATAPTDASATSSAEATPSVAEADAGA